MNNLATSPIDITSHIVMFRNFLNISWPFVDVLMENHDWEEDGNFIDDWIQINWEFLIEREILGKGKYLATLEWNSRITFPDERAKYEIACEITTQLEMKDWILKSNNYEGEDLLLFGFRSPINASYGLYPPFDFVEVRSFEKVKTYIVPLDCCNFWLKPMSGKIKWD
ncbi:MAG: hypothetical protein H0T62_06650 [Parachlamydiaceae bacterium]|nr:hypothetical protein [Parachlamydiaceae bacterium]